MAELGVADGWVVILSCLSDSIIHELMDERVNELRVGPAQPGLTQTVRLIMAPFSAFSAGLEEENYFDSKQK